MGGAETLGEKTDFSHEWTRINTNKTDIVGQVMLLLVALLLVVQDVTPEKCVVSGVAVHAQTGEPLNKVQ
jgi:hypothetical protein